MIQSDSGTFANSEISLMVLRKEALETHTFDLDRSKGYIDIENAPKLQLQFKSSKRYFDHSLVSCPD